MANKEKTPSWIWTYRLHIFSFLIGIAWATAYMGSFDFNKANAISVYRSIIQGISAILDVSIAVIIFRIQSLENRRLSIEQSTLDYIYRISRGYSFTHWIPIVEEHIENGIFSDRYYKLRVGGATLTPERQRELEKDKDNQQRRLNEVLNSIRKIGSTIRIMKNNFIRSTALLASPIIVSLLMLIASDTLNAINASWNFSIMSFAILISAMGILFLILTVIQSTVD